MDPAVIKLKRVGIDYKVGGSYFKQQFPSVWPPVKERESPWIVGILGKINLALQRAVTPKVINRFPRLNRVVLQFSITVTLWSSTSHLTPQCLRFFLYKMEIIFRDQRVSQKITEVSSHLRMYGSMIHKGSYLCRAQTHINYNDFVTFKIVATYLLPRCFNTILESQLSLLLLEGHFKKPLIRNALVLGNYFSGWLWRFSVLIHHSS
jgi:hypothetical protein